MFSRNPPPRRDVAQVCRNGHLITSQVNYRPQTTQNFCNECGAATLTKCETCGTDIPGAQGPEPGVFRAAMTKPPAYCQNCGTAYPWTQSRIEAVREYIQEIAELDEDEKEKLQESLPDIITDTPKSQLAQGRFMRAFGKLSNWVKDEFRSLLVDVASETFKKVMTGS